MKRKRDRKDGFFGVGAVWREKTGVFFLYEFNPGENRKTRTQRDGS